MSDYHALSILAQAIDDGAFDGGEITAFGDYAVSWDTNRGLVAIATDSGWWTMESNILAAIAAATPNQTNK
jgi:hypothetical protein